MTSRLFDPPSPPDDEPESRPDAEISYPARDNFHTSLETALADYRRRLRLLDSHVAHSRDATARSQYARRLATGSALFRALSLELAKDANDLAPISRLPTEVFLMIVKIVTINEPPYGPSRTAIAESNSNVVTTSGSLGWIRLLHVCTVWRATLSQVKSLWAQHLGCLPKAFSTFMVRSGTAMPLTINLDFRSWLHIPSFDAYLRHTPMWRVQSMTWKLRNPADAAHFIHALGSTPVGEGVLFPILESLEIRSPALPDASHNITLKPMSTPRLRTLVLDHIPCLPFIMPCLTSLVMSHSSVSIPILCNLVGQCAALASIELRMCSMSDLDAPINTRYSLPHLNFLSLYGCEPEEDETDDDIYDVFQKFWDFPTSARVVLSPTAYPINQETDEGFVSRLEARLLSAIRLCMRTASGENPATWLLFGPDQIQLLSVEEDPNEECLLIRHLGHVIPRATLYHPFNPAFAQAIVDAISFLDYSSITTLSIDVDAVIVPWGLVFPHLHNVETLHIANKTCAPLQLLCRTHGDEHAVSAADRQVLLPHLKLLWIDRTSYGDARVGNGLVCFALLSMLQNRRALLDGRNPSRMDHLRALCLQNFEGMKDTDEYVRSLRELVPDVQVLHRTPPSS